MNFGKKGKVFKQLKVFKQGPAGCSAHILHNRAKHAYNFLPVDEENIVLNTFNYFASSTKRTKELKEFYEFVDIEWQELLRHMPVRWLTLWPAIDRLVTVLLLPAIKSYFLSQNYDEISKLAYPKQIYNFFYSDVLELDNDNSSNVTFGELCWHFLHIIKNEALPLV